MSVSAFSQLSSVSKLVTVIQCEIGVSESTSWEILLESGGIISNHPTTAIAARWRFFRGRIGQVIATYRQKVIDGGKRVAGCIEWRARRPAPLKGHGAGSL